MTTEPWAATDEDIERATIRRELAGFYANDADLFHLPPEQAAILRSMELAERAEERERQERLEARREHAENVAFAEAARRAQLAGEAWDPANPLKHYPTRRQRIEMAFATQDALVASQLAQARREAAAVLRKHGVHGQVVVDANVPPSPHPGLEPSPGAEPPAPGSSSAGSSSVPEVAASRTDWQHTRDPNREATYSRMRIRRWRDRINQARTR